MNIFWSCKVTDRRLIISRKSFGTNSFTISLRIVTDHHPVCFENCLRKGWQGTMRYLCATRHASMWIIFQSIQRDVKTNVVPLHGCYTLSDSLLLLLLLFLSFSWSSEWLNSRLLVVELSVNRQTCEKRKTILCVERLINISNLLLHRTRKLHQN